MMVEIAPDRLHHGFWRFCRNDHRLFEPGNQYQHVLRDFYTYLDSCIGSLLNLLDDDTVAMVLSDHGAKTMSGGICINEWLVKNGYLVLRKEISKEINLTPDLVDWSRTSAWSEGGYYARVFLNVKGREPQGIIEPSDYESFRDELEAKLLSMTDEFGKPLANKILRPEKVYRRVTNIAPDLIVYFDGLNRRAIGTLGHGKIHVYSNNTGPDDANHDLEGIFIATRMKDLRKGSPGKGLISNLSCLDITPTILHEFGLKIPEHMGGQIISRNGKPENFAKLKHKKAGIGKFDYEISGGYTAEEEQLIKKRLIDLGYL